MAGAVTVSKADRVVFNAGNESYSVRDVLDAAEFRGELHPHFQQLLNRCSAEEKAKQTGAELDQQEMNAAAVAFRYKHDLITAEETEKWLEQRALTLGDYSDYFVREFWAKTFASRTPAAAAATPFHTATVEQRELLVIELTFSGALDQLAKRLAWRVAARRTSEGAAVPQSFIEQEEQRFRSRVADVQQWLTGLGRDEAWLHEMLATEAAFQARRSGVLTADARQRELGAFRLPLTRFEVEMIELESHGAAREAFLCVRDDGMTMEEVAQEGRYPYRRVEMVLDQIDADQQQQYLSSQPGTVMQPTPRGDGFQLARLLGKREPTLNDPEVQARVEQRLLTRHFADLSMRHIRWQLLID
jgi:hypothetical protein